MWNLSRSAEGFCVAGKKKRVGLFLDGGRMKTQFFGSFARARLGLGAFLVSCMVETELALAQTTSSTTGSLSEVETTTTWVLNIFSPALCLGLLTILLIGCGLAVYFGRMSGQLFVKVLLGSVLVFGARTIAPKLQGIFG
jgi:type IV secretory pathway VirB2 component (pilin)